jgi:hypothetical protein
MASFNDVVQQLANHPDLPNYLFTYDNFLGYRHPIPLILMVAIGASYLVLVYRIWPLIRPLATSHRGVFQQLRKFHNIFLFLYSAVCCFGSLGFMYVHGELNIFDPATLTFDFTPMICNENLPQWIWLLNLSFVLSKIYEWLDTAFLVWMKRDASKDLSFLHVYHHATTFWLFLNVSNFKAQCKIGMVVNGFVHTLMYAHYAWPFPKPIVPLITAAQILQLIFVTWVWNIIPVRCPLHKDFMTTYFWEWITNFLFVPVYLIFFVKYFVGRFIFGRHSSSGKGARSGKPATGASAASASRPQAKKDD